jgi:cell division protein FtsI/penicillin-binding protein 2
VLAQNIAVYAVQIRPGDLSLTIRAQVVKTLGEILNMDPVRIITLLDRSTGSLWEPIRIANNVNERAARLINEEHASLPGVETIVESRRVLDTSAELMVLRRAHLHQPDTPSLISLGAQA